MTWEGEGGKKWSDLVSADGDKGEPRSLCMGRAVSRGTVLTIATKGKRKINNTMEERAYMFHPVSTRKKSFSREGRRGDKG